MVEIGVGYMLVWRMSVIPASRRAPSADAGSYLIKGSW